MNSWIRVVRLSFLSLAFLFGTGSFAQTVATLYDFGNRTDGQNPQAGVIFDDAGNLYGAAALGGPSGDGIIFTLTPPANVGEPWTESAVHKFSGPPDGAVPVSDLVFSPSGKLFGTTLEGGTHDKGTVFALTPPASPAGRWTERILYSFGESPTDGVAPNAAVLPASGGFFGVTRDGGAHGQGTVFQLTPSASGGGEWVETILYNFAGSPDAAFPSSGLVMDEAGNLYGSTLVGGANDLGAVYQLAPPTNPGAFWTATVIFSFDGSDGTLPFGPLEFDRNGALYGTTSGGGSLEGGTVYQLSPPSQPGGSWTQHVLFNFSGGRDGGSPVAGVKIDNKGRLFGTASTGGNGNPLPGGVIFRLNPPQNVGDPWTEKILHAFGGPDGYRSLSHLIRRGNAVYGTTSAGGRSGTGTVFELTP